MEHKNPTFSGKIGVAKNISQKLNSSFKKSHAGLGVPNPESHIVIIQN